MHGLSTIIATNPDGGGRGRPRLGCDAPGVFSVVFSVVISFVVSFKLNCAVSFVVSCVLTQFCACSCPSQQCLATLNSSVPSA
jgi:hypothetical protein